MTLIARLVDYARALFAAGLVLALIELALVARASSIGALAVLRYAAVLCAEAAWVCVAVGCGVAACATLGAGLLARLPLAPAARRFAGTTAFGALVAIGASLLARTWDLNDDRYHLVVIVPAVSLLGTWGAAIWFSRVPAVPAVLIALAVVVCAAVVDGSGYRGLYVTLHDTLGFWTWLLAARALRPVMQGRGAAVALAAIGVLAQPALLAPGESHVIGSLHGTLEPRMLSVMRKVLDRDRDGASALLGGGDCDDSDPKVHPDACERAQTARDDNCNGSARIPAEPGHAVARTPRSPLPEVYLIAIDALRADFAANARAMPNLHAFAARSLRFARAYSAYPSTSHSLRAIAQARSVRRLQPGAPDLFGLALAAGYDARLRVQLREQRYARGRTALSSEPPEITMPKLAGKSEWTAHIVDATIAELRREPAEGPRLRWLHLFDVHGPWPNTDAALPFRERYARAARALDDQLGRLFAAFDGSERGRNAVVIVFGDHGEQLGEHGMYFHGAALWEQQLRVPLIMRLPGGAPSVVSAPASLIDLAPTLVAYLGLPTPSTFEGHDWLSEPRARPTPPTAELSSTRELLGSLGRPTRHAVIGERYKLMLDVSDNLLEVYDLQRDPEELHPLHDPRAPEIDQLRRALVRFQDLPGCNPTGW